jgi:hypothetical protein
VSWRPTGPVGQGDTSPASTAALSDSITRARLMNGPDFTNSSVTRREIEAANAPPRDKVSRALSQPTAAAYAFIVSEDDSKHIGFVVIQLIRRRDKPAARSSSLASTAMLCYCWLCSPRASKSVVPARPARTEGCSTGRVPIVCLRQTHRKFVTMLQPTEQAWPAIDASR